MGEEKTAGQKVKEVLKSMKKMATPLIAFLILLVILIGSLYLLFKKDYKDMAKNGATYGENAMISPTDGIVSYVKDEAGNYVTDENGNKIIYTAEDVLEKIKNISRYLKDDEESTQEEKLEYLLNAELVTKFPYIEGLAEDKVNGVVKFYRYSNETEVQDPEQEKYLLKFIDEEAFDNKLQSKDADIFDYFTIDEEQQLVIACKTDTVKIINTDDPYITTEVINNTSSESYAKNGEGTFSTGKSTIIKQTKDYQSIIQSYVMPFNLLAAFLTQTGSYSFTKDLAELAYETEINIGIYENESISERTDKYNYKKRVEYSASTELDFSGVNTSNPVMNINTLKNIRPSIRKSCIAQLAENEESKELTVSHTFTNLDGTGGTKSGDDEHLTVQTAKVDSISGNLITGLGDGEKTFETTYYTKTISRTSLTLGTILADTWVARWEAKYSIEVPEEGSNPTGSSGRQDNSSRKIISCTSSADLFADSAKEIVDQKLTEHTNELLNNAKNAIIKQAEGSYTVSTRTMSATDIKNHASYCNSCETILDNKYGNGGDWRANELITDTLLLLHVQSQSDLEQVKNHVNSALLAEANQDMVQAQNQFKSQLQSQIKTAQYPTVALTDVDITYSTTTIRNATTYKKDTTERTKDGEKFKKVFNDSKHHEARKSILERTQWFWECIRETDDTAKLENILRYLLNIATGTNQFGNFSEEDIENLFTAFEPKELMKSAGNTGMTLLKEYIRTFENGPVLSYLKGESTYTDYISSYISEDKTMYYMQTDGYEHPTIGFGVDIYNGSLEGKPYYQILQDAGYTDFSQGAAIPVDIIDELEEETIRERLEFIREELEELDLKVYQIYALVSRTYNCGEEGAIEDLYTQLTFKEAYNQYYAQEKDDKYGQTLGDFSHLLYTEYMDVPIKSNGEVAPGLVTRRKSEWTLFQTGYMDNIDRMCGIADYPDEIRTFEAAGYIFPEYPQTSTVGDTSLYAYRTYGDPAYGRTLGSSGCGAFSTSMILSGLLGDSSIDPITFTDTLEKHFGYSYYVNNVGSSHCVWSNEFLNKYYGVSSETCYDYDTVINALNEGKAAIGGEPGHILAIIPLPDEYKGSDYEFFVLDSAFGHTGPYRSAEDFMSRNGVSSFDFLAIITP